MTSPRRSPFYWRGVAAGCCAAGLTASAVAEPVLYRLDPDHSFVHFEVLHFGTSTSRGRFGPLQGVITLDRAAHTGDVGLKIPVASVSTGLAVFDSRLRADDLLDTTHSPDAWFVSRDFRFEGDALTEVHGELTLRDLPRGLTLRALRFACRPTTDPVGERCGGDFEAHLKRSDYGMTFGLPLVGDDIRLLVQIDAVRVGRAVP